MHSIVESGTNSKLTASGILAEQLHLIWGEVKPFLEEALLKGGEGYTLDDVYLLLRNREGQLWVVYEKESLRVRACAVTIIKVYPLKRVCFIWLVAGEGLKEFLLFHRMIEEWAMEHKCSEVEGVGRPGWEKVARGLGYKRARVTYRKMLAKLH